MSPYNLEFAGYALCSSPFEPGLWAAATAANFGIVGNGRLHVVRAIPQPDGSIGLQPVCTYDTNSGLYDCAWSEQSEQHLLCASADGSIKLYDLSAATGGRPVMAFCEHQVWRSSLVRLRKALVTHALAVQHARTRDFFMDFLISWPRHAPRCCWLSAGCARLCWPSPRALD